MRIGIMAGATEGPDGTLDGLIRRAQQVENLGFHSLWVANIFGHDAINALGIVGRETSAIELGTAVVPTYPRHPVAIAQQALTSGVACKGRFTLGIGLSHKVVIEDMLGMSYDKPARHMREYLQILAPLLRGEPVAFQGEHYEVQAGLQLSDAEGVPLLVAALGPVMLGLAAKHAEGTITWMCGPKTLSEHIIPTINGVADEAGRDRPRVVGGFPVAVTNDVATAKEKVGEMLQIYGTLPSYRAMLDREGVEGPADIALLGDEKSVADRIAELADLGLTDLDAAIVPVDEGTGERTLEFLAGLLS